MQSCLICDRTVEEFLSFGKMPIANGFLRQDQFKSEYFFELKVGFCPTCTMVQLTELVDREKMFHENYAFFSSTSKKMAIHFERFAQGVIHKYLKASDPFVVEIGSNDGIMLKHFAARGLRHLGVEPSANVARIAQQNGINTLCRFFDDQTARDIVSQYGQADAFLGANVMCHIPYIHSVISGIKTLLKPDGVVVFEDPYLGDIIEKTSYDQIYDEHAFYFSVSSVNEMFARHGMEVIDIESQNVHGGSMRYTIANKGRYAVSPAVFQQREREQRLGLGVGQTFHIFRKNVERSRDQLHELLVKCKTEGRRVVGYAATSKSTTVTNYCGITPDLVDFICDTTPLKHGTFSPGVHIPVRPYEEFKEKYPDYALLFGWNHSEEIMEKEKAFKAAGGKWIVYVPKVGVLQ
jgi:methylation protein EvaC